MEDESDQEEEALVNDYKEQVQFDDGMSDLAQVTSGGGGLQDMQAQLAAAATPLEYQATLETKFASYDNYCSLFHYILNSDGPVDLEVPSVSASPFLIRKMFPTDSVKVLLGLGCHRRIYLPIRVLLPVPQQGSQNQPHRRRSATPPRQPKHLGLLFRP